jgi:uncharacterized protein (TIGR02145 family)
LQVIDSDGAIGYANTNVFVNTEPKAFISVSQTSGDINTAFQFDASSSIDNEEFKNLKYSWDWENDGIWDIENSDNPIETHKYNIYGYQTVKLRAADNYDLFDDTTQSINVYETDFMTDIDGNIYKTVKIGNQWWMAENLKVTHYRNGDAIQNVIYGKDWSNLTTGAYCSYENKSSNIEIYGLLYNWYCTKDIRNIAPEGWHVSTHKDWEELERYMGMNDIDIKTLFEYRGTDEGSRLKTEGWSYYPSNVYNITGFSALPGGLRHLNNAAFYDIGVTAYFWSHSPYDSDVGGYRCLTYNRSGIRADMFPVWGGFSIRCIKD